MTNQIPIENGWSVCACCEVIHKRGPIDPWEGRLDDYCHACALQRCDAVVECERRQAVIEYKRKEALETETQGFLPDP